MKKEKKEEVKVTPVFTSEQFFFNSKAEKIQLVNFLKVGDWWEQKGRKTLTVLLTHDAVQKIAKEAGLVCKDYKIVTQPDIYNNFQYTVQADIIDSKGNTCEPQWGEANRSNLGSRGRNNPANMAQKRSYDRTVLKCLGIQGILSEEELSDKEEEQMEELTHDERKQIAPLLNNINLAKTKADLNHFNGNMKILVKQGKHNEKQLEFLRKMFIKRMTALANIKTF